MSKFLFAGMGQRRVDGAEAELMQATGSPERSIPFACFESRFEVRADVVTAAPAEAAGVNSNMIVPSVFSDSIAVALGISMPPAASGPWVLPKIGTDLSAAAIVKGAAAEATAGVLTIASTTPHRLTARLATLAEDVAQVGASDFDSALKMNLRQVLGNTLDKAILNGDGTAPNISGLLDQLTATAAPAAVATYLSGASSFAALVEGIHAAKLADVTIVVNAATYALLASTFSLVSGESVVGYIQSSGGMVVCNAQLPAAAANITTGVAVRRKLPVAGYVPMWSSALEISDPYTGSASAKTFVTLHTLVGDVMIPQAGSFAEFKVKTA